MKMEDCIRKGLLKPHSFPDETIKKELENAKRHLENAERNYKFDMMDVSIISSYTAMFHAARALLFKDGFKERSHVCLVAFLRERYPELKGYADVFDIYRKNRHESLYGIDYEPLESDAKAGSDSAREFIETVKKIIEEPAIVDDIEKT
ncbi:MAG TPA: HEPN domain-containing protein [Euryarchaeota archaeon]|nr:HEPN domain-containing protein [Euryarchaeota archaeon]